MVQNVPPSFETLRQKLEDQTAIVGVIGMGYVGLPLVKTFADCGYRCLGFDTDPAKVEKLTRGESYIKHIAGEWIATNVKMGRFSATTDTVRMAEADVLLICVPTPLDSSRDPDLKYVERTAEAIAQSLRPGQLVVLESTTYPSTTKDIVLPILEKSSLKPGIDFFVAYSPEREDPGNPKFTAANIPKVIGGLEEYSLQLACQLYQKAIVEIIPVSSLEVAEACKILENTYRAVNIAMVNELKVLFDRMNLDLWEVIEAAKTKPFGFQAFYPGPGLGGHCIPIDPFYLSWLARKEGMPTRFIELAGEINTSMPQFVVQKLMLALNEQEKAIRGSNILMLGVAYKPNVDDPRESPAFAIMELLEPLGANISYNDPYIPQLPSMRSFEFSKKQSVELSPETLAAADVVLIVTNHNDYDWEFIAKHSKLIVDTRNALVNIADRSNIRKA
ncbi:nucleotide sugar dehydrogenase [Bremerella sp. JC817]|uniref:nucleotide sugar dehydrogenase n=1 Tax=Bremerella sp. JC817 TaxID=3231756 RepID=UPI003457DBB7